MKRRDQIKVYVVDYGRECLYMRYKNPLTGKYVTRSTEVRRDGARARKAAESVASKWEAELQEGRYKSPSKVTWAEFRERYEDEVLPGLAENTAGKVAATFNAVEEHINPRLLADLTAERISVLTKALRDVNRTRAADPAKAKKKKLPASTAPRVTVNGLSEATIKGHLAHLMSALRWAHKLGLLVEVPKVDRPKRAKKSTRSTPMKGRPITGEEFDRMLVKVRDVVLQKPKTGSIQPPELSAGDAECVETWQHLHRGLWWSGLRLDEAMQLWWDRDDKLTVDLSGRFPMLRIRSELEKGNEERLLPIAPEFGEFLLATPPAKRTGPVFNPLPQRVKGARLTTHRVGEIISAIGQAAGVKVATDARTGRLKYASAHDLRRSFGDRWSHRVMPIVLQQLMRHQDINTTLRYYVGRDAETTSETVWKALSGNTSGNSSAPSDRGAKENAPQTESAMRVSE
jgi:integrase